ncbi:ATP-binding protein [Motilimonas sp. 1_MG-2023]|uniref:ATP-binding protein n=1 Tax=Motilimonas sp. 1_MG-2023 TaxID=3062672 RepID=UPI0026E36201|nr:ATP-binding protein [Motilimonas sp. 1_MG-2023]MDO6527136.1 ATP-binding protein [Motilimonas sp. 1_MG-2023]
MKLKKQLLFISILMLGLPWAGCQSMQEITQVLARSQENLLENTLSAASLVLSNQNDAITPRHHNTLGPAIYAVPAQDQIQLDGYQNDWQQPTPPFYKLEQGQRQLNIAAQYRGEHLYLWITTSTDQNRFDRPGHSEREQFKLKGLSNQQQISEYTLSTAGSGLFYFSSSANSQNPRYSHLGFWREVAQGAQIEIKLPLNQFNRGLSLDWQIYQDNRQVFSLGTQNTFRPLLHQDNKITQILAPVIQQGIEVYLVDQQGWLLSQVTGKRIKNDIPGFWLMEKIYAWLLDTSALPEWRPLFERSQLVYPQFISQFQQATWFREGYRSHLLMVQPLQLDPTTTHYLVATQRGEVLIRLAGSAFNRLFFISLLAFIFTAGGLFAYASWLTWRINKLSASALQQLQQEAEFTGELPLNSSQDELGSLSRSFSQLLALKQQQTDYLSSLAAKLSHEIRTPLAVIRSSIDNLTQGQNLDEEQITYIQRATNGCTRLSQMITAMSEAKRLEQSLNDFELDTVTINDMLQELTSAYQHTWPSQAFIFVDKTKRQITAEIYPELLVQALDKLIDNAIDFAEEKSEIELILSDNELDWQIEVYNQGNSIPESMARTIFDSLVSVRATQSDKAHLGLGLFIVSMIMKHHKGTFSAKNTRQGVAFSLNFAHFSRLIPKRSDK